MRKVFLICIVMLTLCFAFETFGAEMVSTNYGYKFKAIPKLQESPSPVPKPTQVKKDVGEPKKTPTATPKRQENSAKSSNNSNPINSERDNQPVVTQVDQNANRQTIKESDNKKDENSGSWLDSIWNILLWLAGGVAGLAVLGGLCWLAYSMVSNTFKQERETNDRNFKLVRKDNQEFGQKVYQLEQTVKLQSGQLTQIQTSIQSLQRQILEIGGQNHPQQQAIFTPSVYKPEPQFPVSAEDYLNKVSANAQTATPDFIAGLLINDASKGNEFLIVRDNELSENLFYAVPNQARFDTKSDYFNYYQKYYIFDNPSGGAFQIKSPTIVQRVEGGWKLEQMGELSGV